MNFFTRKYKASINAASNKDRQTQVVQPLGIALEQRIMFDGAAVATALDHAQDGDANEATPVDGKHVVVVDTTVKDYQKLLDAIAPEATLVLIQGDENGLDVLLTALNDMGPIDALHIISHGDTGGFSLGLDSVTVDNLADQAGALSAIGQSLTENGDILLYGCAIAADDTGVQFINDLALATGADVAASNDLTGSEDKGGDWDLEVITGEVTTKTPFSDIALKSYNHVLATETFETGWTSSASNTASGTMFGEGFELTGSNSDFRAYAAASNNSTSGGSKSLLMFDNFSNSTLTTGILQRAAGGGLGAGEANWNLDSFRVTYTIEDLTITPYLDGNELTAHIKTVTGTGNGSDGSMNTLVSWGSGILVDKVVFSVGLETFMVAIDDLTGSIPAAGPTIDSATYDAASGHLVVTGTGFTGTAGAANDVDASKLTITGEGGETYTLTTTVDVEITSGTEFTLILSSADKAALNQIMNKNGTSSTSATTYDVDGAAGFIVASAATADTDANGVTVSNVSAPTITSATYDYTTNTVTVTGEGFVKKTGATNDVDLSKLTFTGESGQTYTLTTASDVEITDGTSFSFTLTGADLVAVESLLNQDGASSSDSTTYNLAGASGFMTGDSTSAADATNGVTVSNYTVPSVDSATFDYSTGVLVVSGSSFVFKSGASNDVDVSLLTFVGEGGEQYQLTSASDVDVTSDNSYTITLSGIDLANVRGLLNKNGTSAATSGTTFNLVSADNWMAGSPDGNNVADASATITVSNYAAPTITSATYDYTSNVLTVTGTNFVAKNGALNDVDVSTLTFTGEGGTTYTLTSGVDVEIIDGTTFSITLSGADLVNVESILNKNGTTSATSGTTYNIAVADNWMAQAPAGADISDLTGNSIVVSNYAAPEITGSTYDWATGQFVFTATNLVGATGASNDIDASLFTITGEGGATYTLSSTTDVDITSATSFTLTLSAADRLAVNGLLNKDGATADSGTTFNISAADNWATGAPAANNIADTTTGVTVSNYTAPTISSATYDYSTNVLTVTGTDFVSRGGANNDVDVSTFTLTGEGGATYTLTSAVDVEITSATSFTITLSTADAVAVEALLNKNGTTSADGTTFNLGVADNWMAGANPTNDIADTTGNGVTVSNYAAPLVTSATFDWASGQLVVTGQNLVSNSGASNDIDASLLTFTGAGGTYTLTDTSDVEITSGTSFTLNLSATDLMNIRGLLNKDGTSGGDATTYNLAFADNWATGAPTGTDIADLTGNVITVSGVGSSTVTSASYDSDTGVLTVTGTNFVKRVGADNDIDISTITLTGGVGGQTYTITSASDVEITSATSFTITLTGADKTNIDSLLDKVGTASSNGTTYNIGVVNGWMAGADSAQDLSDATNAVTVSINPKITSATYDASTGQLVVTGTNILSNGGGLDIDASKFTLTGEGGETYTLINTTDVNITSDTGFTLVLSAVDKAALNQIINKAGTVSTGGTTFAIAAADDWNTAVTVGDTSDTTGNGVTASNIGVPSITSATYDVATGVVVLTGENFSKLSGAGNDIDASLLTFTGEGGETYTLTDTADVDITNATTVTLTLSTTDRAALALIINKDGLNATGGAAYKITAAEDWAKGADSAVAVVDSSGDNVNVSNVVAPTVSGATYDNSTGRLTISGSNFVKYSGAANDIIANKVTITGQNLGTYTLTDSANVDIQNGTTFVLTLSATDKAAVNALLDKSGTLSSDGTTYNIAMADDWAAGADAGVDIVDATNTLTVTISATPSDTEPNVPRSGPSAPVVSEGELDNSRLMGNRPLLGDSMIGYIGNPPASRNVQSITTGQVMGNDRSLGFTSQGVITDPASGVNAMSIVRNVVSDNSAGLNSFYGSQTTVGVGLSERPHGLGGGLGASGSGFGLGTGLQDGGQGLEGPQSPQEQDQNQQTDETPDGDDTQAALEMAKPVEFSQLETPNLFDEEFDPQTAELMSFSTQIEKNSSNPKMEKLERALGLLG